MDLFDPYSAWVSLVKSQGATVVGSPLDGSLEVPRGSPLARYPKDVALSLISAGVAPSGGAMSTADIVSHSGSYWYFVAPADVLEFFFSHDMSTVPSAEAVKKGTDELEPEWFKRLSQTAQVVTVIAIAGGAMYGLNALQSFLPRRNPRPRRRS